MKDFRRIFLSAFVIIAVSFLTICPVLLLVEHKIRYVLYAFGVALSVLLTLNHVIREFSLELRFELRDKTLFLGFALSVALLASNLSGFCGPIALVLSICTVSFVPGLILLKLLGIKSPLMETLALAFGISILLAGLTMIPLLRLPENVRGVTFSSCLVGFSVFSIVKSKFTRARSQDENRESINELKIDLINF